MFIISIYQNIVKKTSQKLLEVKGGANCAGRSGIRVHKLKVAVNVTDW